ncbi:hypothetical protein FDA27_03100 [Clostridium botulinum]|nr:hypothetical protein [Clostridium botulinum]
MILRFYDLLDKTEFDSKVFIWENVYKVFYKNNLEFPQNAKYKWKQRYVLEGCFKYKGKKSEKMEFSGDTDFNFKTSEKNKRGKRYICDEFYKIIEKEEKEDKAKAQQVKALLDECKTYEKWNVSIMPRTGSLQTVKQGVGRDRLDTFIWCLDQHYNGNSLLFNYCAAAYIPSLKSFLGLFSSVYEYCECIYNINDELVDLLIKSGAKPIDNVIRVQEYVILAKKFWHQKKYYLNYGENY